MEELLGQYNDLVTTFHREKRNLSNKIREDLGRYLFDKMQNVTNLTGLTWTQYTPYFADGSPCVFGVNELRFIFSSPPSEDNYYHYDNLTYELSYRSPDPAAKELIEAFQRIPDEIYQEIFGDHATITAKKIGDVVVFEAEECEHD